MTRTYPVHLFFERGLAQQHVSRTARLFQQCPGPVSVHFDSTSVELSQNAQGELAWDHLFSTLAELRKTREIPDTDFVFLLTKTPNEKNWFAAEDPKEPRNAFGHFGEFEWVTSAPGHVIAGHYILKGICNALLSEASVPWQKMWHEDARGCLFDFCQNKGELDLKLRTADICGDCMQLLKSARIPDEFLEQAVALMEESRKMAINTGQYLRSESEFNDWPFPVAITRHKIVQARKPLLRFMLLLDHFDCLVRYFYLAHEVWEEREPSLAERPSLGWWVDQLAHSLRGQAHFRSVVRIAEQAQIVNLRNETRGHGWMAASEDSYLKEAESLEDTLSNIEDELSPFFEEHRLVIPHETRLEDGRWVVEGEHLVGSNVLHPSFQIEVEQDPRGIGIAQTNDVYITNNQMDQFMRISPWIVSATCPKCRHKRILITDGERQFIDVFMGHRVSLNT